MPWRIFTGDGPTDGTEPWRNLPDPPPWRQRATAITSFVLTDDLVDAVNTALHLRRPLLLTGAPGSGKSTLVSLIAAELGLDDPLNWHITSRSTLQDGLYQYDALGRLHATQAGTVGISTHVEDFVTLGPLGTALACKEKPRAVLIDEIDKSDFDLPGDLLNILEEGEFDIPPLVRDARASQESDDVTFKVRGNDRATYTVPTGVVRRTHWPVIVMTSNGERAFPAPFLRRCVRFEMSTPTELFLLQVVEGYLGNVTEQDRAMITAFAQRLVGGERLAIDQLLNYLYLVTGESDMDARLDETVRTRLESTLLEELSGK
ncbi:MULTISPECIES: AAA family ATPase [Amycolatopsis]|uniref:AAA family ATPase n=1 Tax=Amycolatopsis TaxID=1813 RepID=UPI001E4906BD|nr:MoxR family ATPase [Amycolatopsis bullii]